MGEVTEWGEIGKHTNTKAVSIHGRHKESKYRGMYMVEMCLEKGNVCHVIPYMRDGGRRVET